jgi:hypothetical protein
MNPNVAQSYRNINGPVKQSVAIIIVTKYGVPTTPEMSKWREDITKGFIPLVEKQRSL